MTLYFGIKYHADLSNKKHIEQILACLEAAGHTTFCVTRDLETWGEKSFSAKEKPLKEFR